MLLKKTLLAALIALPYMTSASYIYASGEITLCSNTDLKGDCQTKKLQGDLSCYQVPVFKNNDKLKSMKVRSKDGKLICKLFASKPTDKGCSWIGAQPVTKYLKGSIKKLPDENLVYNKYSCVTEGYNDI